MSPVNSCILAIDASTGPCSVAVWHNNKISSYIENTKPIMQSASLIPMIEAALAESGISYSNLNSITATTGPGSFTGIRVGLASALGISIAAGLAAQGYTTLEVLAYAAQLENPSANNPILAIINAGKGECYFQYFGTGTSLIALKAAQVGTLDAALALANAPSVTVVGNVAVEAAGFSHCGITFPRADALAQLSAHNATPAQALRPFYIRPPDAKLPKQNLTSNSI